MNIAKSKPLPNRLQFNNKTLVNTYMHKDITMTDLCIDKQLIE